MKKEYREARRSGKGRLLVVPSWFPGFLMNRSSSCPFVFFVDSASFHLRQSASSADKLSFALFAGAMSCGRGMMRRGGFAVKLGCNTVLFGMVDLRQALQHVVWAGYRYVEFAAIAGMCEHVGPESDRGAVK